MMGLIALSLSAAAANGQPGFVDGVELTSIKAPRTMRILDNDLDITDLKLRPNDEHASYF